MSKGARTSHGSLPTTDSAATTGRSKSSQLAKVVATGVMPAMVESTRAEAWPLSTGRCVSTAISASKARGRDLLSAESTTPRGLPVVWPVDPQQGALVSYEVARVDHRGRIGGRQSLKVLNWHAGLPISVSANLRAGIIVVKPEGCDRITAQGHVRLPARVRHGFGLKPGDRLLIAALLGADLLLLYTTAALDAMLLSNPSMQGDPK